MEPECIIPGHAKVPAADERTVRTARIIAGPAQDGTIQGRKRNRIVFATGDRRIIAGGRIMGAADHCGRGMRIRSRRIGNSAANKGIEIGRVEFAAGNRSVIVRYLVIGTAARKAGKGPSDRIAITAGNRRSVAGNQIIFTSGDRADLARNRACIACEDPARFAGSSNGIENAADDRGIARSNVVLFAHSKERSGVARSDRIVQATGGKTCGSRSRRSRLNTQYPQVIDAQRQGRIIGRPEKVRSIGGAAVTCQVPPSGASTAAGCCPTQRDGIRSAASYGGRGQHLTGSGLRDWKYILDGRRLSSGRKARIGAACIRCTRACRIKPELTCAIIRIPEPYVHIPEISEIIRSRKVEDPVLSRTSGNVYSETRRPDRERIAARTRSKGTGGAIMN